MAAGFSGFCAVTRPFLTISSAFTCESRGPSRPLALRSRSVIIRAHSRGMIVSGPGFRLMQQLPHIVLPDLSHSQALVAARFRPSRKHYGAAALDLRNGALEATQFDRVKFIIGKIDGEQRRLDQAKPNRRIIISRRVELPEDVVCFLRLQRSSATLWMVLSASPGPANAVVRCAGLSTMSSKRFQARPRLAGCCVETLRRSSSPSWMILMRSRRQSRFRPKARNRQQGVHHFRIALAPHPGLHAAHARAQNQA